MIKLEFHKYNRIDSMEIKKISQKLFFSGRNKIESSRGIHDEAQ